MPFWTQSVLILQPLTFESIDTLWQPLGMDSGAILSASSVRTGGVV